MAALCHPWYGQLWRLQKARCNTRRAQQLTTDPVQPWESSAPCLSARHPQHPAWGCTKSLRKQSANACMEEISYIPTCRKASSGRLWSPFWASTQIYKHFKYYKEAAVGTRLDLKEIYVYKYIFLNYSPSPTLFANSSWYFSPPEKEERNMK